MDLECSFTEEPSNDYMGLAIVLGRLSIMVIYCQNTILEQAFSWPVKRQSFAIPRWGGARDAPGKLLLCHVCLVHATGIPERSCLDALASLKAMFKSDSYFQDFVNFCLILPQIVPSGP